MYCPNLDDFLKVLVSKGSVKLPSVKNAPWRKNLYLECLDQIRNKSYAENLPANQNFLIQTNIISDLLPRLKQISENDLGISVDLNDVYNVCRLVRPGDTSEGYRGHFDSHLFTLVTPINIPNFENLEQGGQLHYYPKARKQPQLELQNIFGKIYHKKYNSEQGFKALSKKTERIIDDFQDYRPLLFLGNTTFHGNSPVDSKSGENRMTILTHFFDPSPKYGIGRILRTIRNR